AEPRFPRFPTPGSAGAAAPAEAPGPRIQAALPPARPRRRPRGRAATPAPADPPAPGDDHRIMGLALLGAAELWSGRLEEAAAHLERAVEAAAGAGRAFVEGDATAHLA